MRSTTFTRQFLLLFAGPIIWAVHFLVIYGFTGVLCARPAWREEWLGLNLLAWGISLSSVAAIIMIAALHFRSWRSGMQVQETGFIYWVGAALGIASIIAILWETIPIFLIPLCN